MNKWTNVRTNDISKYTWERLLIQIIYLCMKEDTYQTHVDVSKVLPSPSPLVLLVVYPSYTLLFFPKLSAMKQKLISAVIISFNKRKSKRSKIYQLKKFIFRWNLNEENVAKWIIIKRRKFFSHKLLIHYSWSTNFYPLLWSQLLSANQCSFL